MFPSIEVFFFLKIHSQFVTSNGYLWNHLLKYDSWELSRASCRSFPFLVIQKKKTEPTANPLMHGESWAHGESWLTGINFPNYANPNRIPCERRVSKLSIFPELGGEGECPFTLSLVDWFKQDIDVGTSTCTYRNLISCRASVLVVWRRDSLASFLNSAKLGEREREWAREKLLERVRDKW